LEGRIDDRIKVWGLGVVARRVSWDWRVDGKGAKTERRGHVGKRFLEKNVQELADREPIH